MIKKIRLTHRQTLTHTHKTIKTTNVAVIVSRNLEIQTKKWVSSSSYQHHPKHKLVYFTLLGINEKKV